MVLVTGAFSDGNETRFEIVYDVFLPDANFRKSNPGHPAVCLCVARSVNSARVNSSCADFNSTSVVHDCI